MLCGNGDGDGGTALPRCRERHEHDAFAPLKAFVGVDVSHVRLREQNTFLHGDAPAIERPQGGLHHADTAPRAYTMKPLQVHYDGLHGMAIIRDYYKCRIL